MLNTSCIVLQSNRSGPQSITSTAGSECYRCPALAPRATLYARVKHVVPPIEWAAFAPLIKVFNSLRQERYATIPEANYMTPVISHIECPPDVIEAADSTGSTSSMINFGKDRRPPRVVLVTECSKASNVSGELPELEFVKPCDLCPHMKRFTLDNILDSLLYMQHEATVPPEITSGARRAVERVINLTG